MQVTSPDLPPAATLAATAPLQPNSVHTIGDLLEIVAVGVDLTRLDEALFVADSPSIYRPQTPARHVATVPDRR
jgi:hypothetical protein